MTKTAEKKTGLDLLREPFAPNQISKLPKPTKAQTDEVKADFKKGKRCLICGAWHHPDVVHLDYVGHAALTDRLLDCDPLWNWEPFAVGSDGYPVIDKDGGMWIRLTVCGVTRPGYGDAQGKTGGDAMKERIGDALRNAAMRFGAALDLWHKGDLHVDEVEGKKEEQRTEQKPQETKQDDAGGQKPAGGNPISEAQVKMIFAKGKSKGMPDNAVKEHFKVASTKDIQKEQINDILKWIDAWTPSAVKMCAECRGTLDHTGTCHNPSCPDGKPEDDIPF